MLCDLLFFIVKIHEIRLLVEKGAVAPCVPHGCHHQGHLRVTKYNGQNVGSGEKHYKYVGFWYVVSAWH